MSETVTPVIGLEIHVELATETKMFCRCRNHFGDPPNTHVCPVCTSMPGALPVMNAQAVEHSMKAGLALGCEVPAYTKWDRKGYYYPDLPKNYQISQYDLPLAEHGVLEVPLADGSTKAVRIRRAHLEEDAGKNIHDNPGFTGVDLNRAGVPLLEIVTEPDMNTVEEVHVFARAMQRLVRWLGVSEANMQMGHMRFEPNINLVIERDGKTYRTPIVEVKNLNSFRALENTVHYEIGRQLDEWRADPDGYAMGKMPKQNRGYDDATERTVHQRHKEEAEEYRYFPDPDLPAVIVSDEWRERVRESIGELPLPRKQRFMDALGLNDEQADGLTQDAETGDLLDAAVSAGADAVQCAKILMGKARALANEQGCAIAAVGLSAGQLAELAKMMTLRRPERDGGRNGVRQDRRDGRVAEGGRRGRRTAGGPGRRADRAMGRRGAGRQPAGRRGGPIRRQEGEEGLRLPDGPGDAGQQRRRPAAGSAEVAEATAWGLRLGAWGVAP